MDSNFKKKHQIESIPTPNHPNALNNLNALNDPNHLNHLNEFQRELPITNMCLHRIQKSLVRHPVLDISVQRSHRKC